MFLKSSTQGVWSSNGTAQYRDHIRCINYGFIIIRFIMIHENQINFVSNGGVIFKKKLSVFSHIYLSSAILLHEISVVCKLSMTLET